MKSILNKVTSLTLLTGMGTFMSCGNNNPTQGSQSVIKSIQNETSGNYLVATQFGEQKSEPEANSKKLNKLDIRDNLAHVLKALKNKKTFWTVDEFNKDGVKVEQITETPITGEELKKALRVLSYGKMGKAVGEGVFYGLGSLYVIWSATLNSYEMITKKALFTKGEPVYPLKDGILLGSIIIIPIINAIHISHLILNESFATEGENIKYNTWFPNPMAEIQIRQQRAEAIASTENNINPFTQQKYKFIKERLQAEGKAKNK